MDDKAEDKLTKRRLNEFEDKLKRLQRELQELKAIKRRVARMRKEQGRMIERESDLTEVMAEIEGEERFAAISMPEPVTPLQYSYSCRKCHSHKTDPIEMGNRLLIVCMECNAKYTLVSDKTETPR